MFKWITIAFLIFIIIGAVGSDMGTGDTLFFIGFFFALAGVVWLVYLTVSRWRSGRKKDEDQPED